MLKLSPTSLRLLLAVLIATLVAFVIASPADAQSHRGKKSYGWRQPDPPSPSRDERSSTSSELPFDPLGLFAPLRHPESQPVRVTREPTARDSSSPLSEARSVVSAAQPVQVSRDRLNTETPTEASVHSAQPVAASNNGFTVPDELWKRPPRNSSASTSTAPTQPAAVRSPPSASRQPAVSSDEQSPRSDSLAQWLKQKVTSVKMPSITLPFGRPQTESQANHIASAENSTSRTSVAPQPLQDANVQPARVNVPVERNASQAIERATANNPRTEAESIAAQPNSDVPPPDEQPTVEDDALGSSPTLIQAAEHGFPGYYSPRHPDIAAPGLPYDRSVRTAVRPPSIFAEGAIPKRDQSFETTTRPYGTAGIPRTPVNADNSSGGSRLAPPDPRWPVLPVELEPKLFVPNAPKDAPDDGHALRRLPENIKARSIRLTQYEEPTEIRFFRPVSFEGMVSSGLGVVV